MQRIGLFGGSFDPVHCGHLLVAQAAMEELQLARLFFIPAAQSPLKPLNTHAPAAERLRLLRLALAGQSHSEIDEQEVRRGGISFTIDTVRGYTERFPGAELFYLIGADNVPQLPAWREAGALAQLAEFVVVPRPGEAPPAAQPPFRLRVLSGFPMAVSSSQVRARLRARRPIEGLVPAVVAEAIHNSGLYL
jgi:nicotinate-nucleotide adenylyltransferase